MLLRKSVYLERFQCSSSGICGKSGCRCFCDEYERHTWLVNVHERLDAAAADAYGWDADLSDEQVLERLLALNLERYEGEGG